MDYTSDLNISKGTINEGFFQIQRLHEIQKEIIEAKLNPFAYNIDKLTYNFNIIIRNLHSLLMEAWSKLTDDEKIQSERMRKIINDMINTFPPIKTIKNDYLGVKQNKVDYKNWDKIENIIFIYEHFVRECLDTHGLANPNIEGDMF